MFCVSEQLLVALVNYGIAGIVIYMFYTLISQRLERLNESILKLTEEIIRLREEIKKLNGEQ